MFSRHWRIFSFGWSTSMTKVWEHLQWGLWLSDPSAAKFQSLSQETCHFPGPKNDEELPLHFLSENAEEQLWPKLPDEQLAEILFCNLYNPQSVEAWSHLISDNQILEQTCHQPQLWNMVIAIMQVLPLLLGANVTSASMLHSNANNHCLGVGPLPCLTNESVDAHSVNTMLY